MTRKNTRGDVQIAKRQTDVAALYLAGYYQSEIAAELKVSQATISGDLKRIRQAWLQSTLVDINQVQGQELARIDRLEREYWQAWRKSQEEAVKTVTTREADAKGQLPQKPQSARVERQAQVGDPRFLGGVQWCIEQRLKIFGIYEADKVLKSYAQEIIDGLKSGRWTPAQVQSEFPDKAVEWMRAAGVPVAGVSR